MGTFGAALEARGIESAGNLTANVEGDIEDIEGVLRISRIRLQYRIVAPKAAGARVRRAVEVHADACPAYQSVKGCINCSWEVQIQES
jgi:uncharacterized OsmC-like protein